MAMTKFLFIGIFIFYSVIGQGQNKVTDSSATLIAYWKKNDKIKLSLNEDREEFLKGKPSSKINTRSVVDVSVLDSAAGSYTLNWKYSNVKVTGAPANSLEERLAKLKEGMILKYTTNEFGKFRELMNWQELQSNMNSSLEKVSEEFKSREQITMINDFKSIYSSKESIEQMAIRDVILYHIPYGAEYKLKEKVTAQTQLPNFLGGEAFPATVTVQMTELNPKKNYCKIRVDQVLDREKATQIIGAFVQQTLPGEKNITAIPAINITDVNEFEAELLTGWLSRTFYQREALVEDTKNIERFELKKL